MNAGFVTGPDSGAGKKLSTEGGAAYASTFVLRREDSFAKAGAPMPLWCSHSVNSATPVSDSNTRSREAGSMLEDRVKRRRQ
jgi:hypothetical protein